MNEVSPILKKRFRLPAEWQAHSHVWLAWPNDAVLWKDDLISAQEEFIQLCRHLSTKVSKSAHPSPEQLCVCVPDEETAHGVEQRMKGLPVNIFEVPFGDIWLRDTGPIFVFDASQKLTSLRFLFNGWGGKYILPNDVCVASNIGKKSMRPQYAFPFVMEGGAIEVNGEGTCITTRQCLLNPNRNTGWTEKDVEFHLSKAFGVDKVLWLEEGLQNDHTDGHVDTLVRFVNPTTVVCMRPSSPEDHNAKVLNAIHTTLQTFTTARGESLNIVTIPSPGRVTSPEGVLLAASYVNFYIGNQTVVVPTYGTPFDKEAVDAIAALFPTRRVVGASAKAILTGGGAFHCISQQQPAEESGTVE